MLLALKRSWLLLSVASFSLASVATTPSLAAYVCSAVATNNSPFMEDPDRGELRKGQVISAISQYRISKKTGIKTYCVHGGLCYPANVLKLSNCQAGAEISDDSDEVIFQLSLLRTKVSADELRYHDVNNRLYDMGLCRACAAVATKQYIENPQSKCGRTVRLALEGNPVAQKALHGDDACQ